MQTQHCGEIQTLQDQYRNEIHAIRHHISLNTKFGKKKHPTITTTRR